MAVPFQLSPTIAYSAAVLCEGQNKTSKRCQLHAVCWSNFNTRAAENKTLDRDNWTLSPYHLLCLGKSFKIQESRCHFYYCLWHDYCSLMRLLLFKAKVSCTELCLQRSCAVDTAGPPSPISKAFRLISDDGIPTDIIYSSLPIHSILSSLQTLQIKL